MSQILSRQDELVCGVVDLLNHLTVQSVTDYVSADSNDEWSRRDAKWMALSLMMWSCSCVIWRNTNSSCAQQKQTLTLCSEIAPKILIPLARLSLRDDHYFGTISNISLYEHVWKASRWLLCALVRAQPQFLDQLLDFYGFDESPIPENLLVLSSLAHICQSKPAIDRLQNSCSLEIWIQKAVQICEQDQKEEKDLTQLHAIVQCIEELTIMSDVCKLLEQSEYGPAFFRQIMYFLVNTKHSERSCPSSNVQQCERKYFHEEAIHTVANELIPLIRVSFINLTRRCLTYGGKHRARIAKYICKILRDKNENPQKNYSSQPNNKPINDFLLQMLHRLVLDDEIIKVHFTDVVEQLPLEGGVMRDLVLPVHESHKRMVHPIFGCISDDCVLNFGLYSKCSELVPSVPQSEVPQTATKTTYAGKASAKKDVSAAKPTAASSKYSAADHWLKYHGFVPPPSYSSAPISVDGLQQQSMFQQGMQQEPPPPDWDWDMEDEWSDDLNSTQPWTPPGPHSLSSSISSVQMAMPKYISKALFSPLSCNINTIEHRNIQLIDANTQCPLEGETTLGELLERRKNNVDNKDDYVEHMLLCVSMRYVPDSTPVPKRRTSQKKTKNAENLKEIVKPPTPPILSTLDHFAREGGFIELSKHIYLYRRCLTRLLNFQEKLSSDLIERQQRACSNNNVPGTAQPGQQYVQTLSTVPGFNTSSIIPYDFELPSGASYLPPLPSTGVYSNVLTNIQAEQLFNNDWPPLQPVGLGTSGGVVGNTLGTGTSGTPFFPLSGASVFDNTKMTSRQSPLPNVQPYDQFFHNSAHVIVLLGLFLRLEQYGELLIEMDRGKTKQLLRMILDIHSPIISPSSRVAYLRPRIGTEIKARSNASKQHQIKTPLPWNYHYFTQKPSTTSSPSTMAKTTAATAHPFSSTTGKALQNYQRLGRYVSHEQQACQEELLLFPFVVLARLFNNFDPADVGIERAQALRDKALSMGIIDVLLTSLAHFSRHPNRLDPLHPIISDEQPMVELISYVLNAAFRMERLFQLAGTLQQQTIDLQLMIANGAGNATDYILAPTQSYTQSLSSQSLYTATALPTTTLSSTTQNSNTIKSMTTASNISEGTAKSLGDDLFEGAIEVVNNNNTVTSAAKVTSANKTQQVDTKTVTTAVSTDVSSNKKTTTTTQVLNFNTNIGSNTISSIPPTSSSVPPQQQTTTTQTQSDGGFWAKGTGFGSGTTQQQWNLSQHVAKRRQDENNVAALLQILIAFINPKSQRLDNDQQSNTSSKKDNNDKNSSDGIELVLPLFNEGSTTGTKTEDDKTEKNDTEESEDEKHNKKGQQDKHEDDNKIQLSEEFVELLFRSCLLSTLNSYLMNDSVLDISKRVHAFESVISLVATIANASPITISNLSRFPNAAIIDQQGNQDIFDIIFLSGEKEQKQLSHKKKLQQIASSEAELLDRLDKLGKNIEIYLSKLQTGHRVNSTPTAGESPWQRSAKRKAWRRTTATNSSKTQSDLEEEEELGKLLDLVQCACSSINKKKRIHITEGMEFDEEEQQQSGDNIESAGNVASSSKTLKASDAVERFYCDQLKGLQFETIPFFESIGSNNTPVMRIPFHYASSLNSVGSAGGSALGKRTRRLAQEIVSLSSSLPLSISSSVFVRTCEERLDAMKVLITGPADTPYANGCFEFDVFFPPDYPNTPMQMNLETTGNKSVRFNPNLYDDGKVCLSILNTWRGRPEERWNADTSSLLQVLVSIQSLILVNEPYFNEPGYERWRNSPAGQQASREYDANIMQMCVRWAMVEQIRNPPKAFTEIVRSHFWMKRDEICDQIEAWIEDIQHYITTHASSGKILPSYLAGLKKHYETLKTEFKNMTAPIGLEEYKSKRFNNEKKDDKEKGS